MQARAGGGTASAAVPLHYVMTSFMLFPPASVPLPAFRLAVGLVFSVLAHLLLMAGLRPMATAYAPPRPFQVEIRPVEPDPAPAAPVTITGAADFPAAVTVAPPPADPRRAEAPPPPNTAAAPVAGLDLRFVTDDYYTSREVDVRAEPLNEVQLVYPQLAYQRRVKGRVVLRLLINERGGLDQVAVLESEPRGVFEEAALEATWAVRFSPATKHGRNVRSRKDIEVLFDPYESINIP
jgi:protein TonB